MIYLSVAIVPKSRFIPATVETLDGKEPVLGPDGRPIGDWARVSRPVLVHRFAGWGIADPAVKAGHLIALAQAMAPLNKKGERIYAGKWVRTYAEETTFAKSGARVHGELWTQVPGFGGTAKPPAARCGWDLE